MSPPTAQDRISGNYQPQPQASPAYQSPQPATGGQGTNTWAILGLIFAFIFAPLGIIFSIIALVQIKKTGENGKGLAIAGLIVGIVFTLIWILYFAFIIISLFYFGAMNPGEVMPDKCDIPAGLDCIEKPVIDSSVDTVSFKITNNMGTNITITSLAGSVGDCTGTDRSNTYAMEDGETKIIVYKPGDDFTEGTRVKCRFYIEYMQGEGGLVHKINADITAKAS
jgi:hypothetical protein